MVKDFRRGFEVRAAAIHSEHSNYWSVVCGSMPYRVVMDNGVHLIEVTLVAEENVVNVRSWSKSRVVGGHSGVIYRGCKL